MRLPPGGITITNGMMENEATFVTTEAGKVVKYGREEITAFQQTTAGDWER